MRAIRADGVLIKPDAPILLLDRSILAEAQGKTGLSIATAYSDHAGGRTTYVFGFTGSSASMSFTPAELGYSGSVYVLDVNHSTGRVLTSSQPNTDTAQPVRIGSVEVGAGTSRSIASSCLTPFSWRPVPSSSPLAMR